MPDKLSVTQLCPGAVHWENGKYKSKLIEPLPMLSPISLDPEYGVVLVASHMMPE